MDDVTRGRHRGALRFSQRPVALALVACLLASCSTGEIPDRETRPDLTVGASPTRPASPRPTSPRSSQPPTDAVRRGLPTVPSTRDAAALAWQIESAAATLRDQGAAATDARRAGEFQQLAVHTLATASPAFRREVTARLRPSTAVVVRSDVRAARLLQHLTRPQAKLPRWRILAPPPPEELLGYYHAAQRRTGVPWNYLAAIHLVETRMGRIRGASTAGALGPMQFLPSTWEVYGGGGDINDPKDAILASARLLEANGAPGDMAEALWHYNPSTYYVRAVSEHARTLKRSRSAYRGYWYWRVLYRSTRGTYVLPVGYPKARPVLVRLG